MIQVAGIDIGSTYSKAVLIDETGKVVGRAVRRTGFKLAQASEAVFDELVANAGLERAQVTYVASTGYGRHTVPFRNTQLTELTAHAHAAVHLFPDTRTILDIGGQDIKAIRVDGDGRVKAFRLNDKCAAGTGAFLEKTARYLGLTTDDIGPYASRSTNPKPVSSVCAVFAESEVISHLASGVPAEDIMMGAMVALGGRAVQLMRRVGLEPGYMLTGGMTRNVAMIKALEDNLKDRLHVAPDGLGQLNGALGAALLGLRRVQKLIAEGRPIAVAQGAADGEVAKTRKRWSAIAVKRAEPCRGDGCSVASKFAKQPAATPA
jgi:predicted CoA-substrate-specific enzyme activase